MSSSLTPYNFTISDQSPLFQYLPFRDGLIDTSWNVTYTGIYGIVWAPNSFVGAGRSSHRTSLVGASVQLDWIGTAIYLYGEAPDAGYIILLDGSLTTDIMRAPELLFAKSDLDYGSHSLILQVVHGEASIFNATITVGMGAIGTTVIQRTIETTQVPLTVDGVFLNGNWVYFFPYGGVSNAPYPRIATSAQGATISFTLTSASAFYIMGGVNCDHGPYTVTMNPSPDSDSQFQALYNGLSRWIGLDAVKFLATGMNRSKNYEVAVTNGNSSGTWFDMNRVVVLDTPPSSSQSSDAGLPRGSLSLGTGPITGIVVGCVSMLFAFVSLLYFRRRQRRRESQTNGIVIEGNLWSIPEQLYARPFPWTELQTNAMAEPSSSSGVTAYQHNHKLATRETDAGPMIENDPPSYDEIRRAEPR